MSCVNVCTEKRKINNRLNTMKYKDIKFVKVIANKILFKNKF